MYTRLNTFVRTIDGVALPATPSSIEHSLKQISLDAYRDTAGTFRETFLGEQDVFTITFEYLTESQLTALKAMLRKRYMQVTHEDYWNYANPLITETMYHGDLVSSPYWIKSNRGQSLYNAYSFELISTRTRKVNYV